uniref:Uncharacterized protein n=1 Tax=Panagrolaimus sp. PS1159 TaxID=55785 RepID=A0AC35GKY4_9BILA
MDEHNRLMQQHPSQHQQQQNLLYEEYYSSSQEGVGEEPQPPPLMPIQYSHHQQPQQHQHHTTRYVTVPHLVHTRPPPLQHHHVQQQQQHSLSSSSTAQVTSSAAPPQQPTTTKTETIELECEENLGRCASPNEFPEYVPGAWDEVRQHKSIAPGKSAMRFRTELDSGDVKLVNELGQLTVDNLLDYMKNLQNNAFLLGEEEAKEFQRAKCLGIFQK